MPFCNSLFSGDRTASAAQLRSVLDNIFGAEFLKQNSAGAELGLKEERRRVQNLLKVLKGNYTFYYQKCLNHEPKAASCNTGGDGTWASRRSPQQRHASPRADGVAVQADALTAEAADAP